MVFPLYVYFQISSSYKAINQIGLRPNYMTLFNLTTSLKALCQNTHILRFWGLRLQYLSLKGTQFSPITESIISGEHTCTAIGIQYNYPQLRKQHMVGITLHSSMVAGVGNRYVEAGGGHGCQWYWPCNIGLIGSKKPGFALCHSHATFGLSTLFRKNLHKQPLHLMHPFKEYLQQTPNF